MSYQVYDAVTLQTTVTETPYIIGSVANAMIPKSWPMLLPDTVPPIPVPTKRVNLLCTKDAFVRLINYDLTSFQALGAYPAGVPPQLHLVANIPYTFDYPCIIIYYVRDTADGFLYLHAFA